MTELLAGKASAREQVRAWRTEGLSIGFVPTMGALHDGHLSLVRAAAERADRVIASIFVNPLQFAPNEDLEKYPRDLEGDRARLATAGCDALFTTNPGEMYPDGFATYIENETVARKLEGEHRPTHFRGVLTVVLKLFHIVTPDVAVFGQKDAQQAFLIERMVKDLDLPVEIHVAPIIREADGLAMSSRNAFLSPSDRERATTLSRAITAARTLLEGGEGNVAALREASDRVLSQANADVDYIAFVDPITFEDVSVVSSSVRILIAARIGDTRLIDNDLLP